MTVLEGDVLRKRPDLEATFTAKRLRDVEVVVVRHPLVCAFLAKASDERVILGTATHGCG